MVAQGNALGKGPYELSEALRARNDDGKDVPAFRRYRAFSAWEHDWPVTWADGPGSYISRPWRWKTEKRELKLKLKKTIFAISLLALVLATACQSSTSGNDAGNIVVVNSPAAGKVKRIVVAEGVHVDRGTPLVEIVVQSEPNVAATPARAGAEVKAVQSYQAADAEIAAARAEAVRHEAEVARLTPLVSSGEASQGQLDGERGLYEQAQRRLTQAQEAKRNAEGALLAARQPNQPQVNNAVTPHEQIVSAVASSSGKVAVITARVGEIVKVGQPLATLRADN